MSEPIVVAGIGQLVTNDTATNGDLGVIENAALVIEEADIRWVGAESELPTDWSDARRIEVDGRAVIPGFVDPHTHLAFAGDRSDEFSRRMAGERYVDIARAGGGILSTVAATRAASPDELTQLIRERLLTMQAAGTTTIEVKSGYGLDLESEVKLLEATSRASKELPVTIHKTFLGAHAVPPEYAGKQGDYVDRVIEMMPAVAPLADFCDVFVEDHAFRVEEARRILEAGADHGLRGRIHAEQLTHSGGARLAAELGAMSADHLDHVTAEDASMLAEAGTVAVLVPGASFQLRGPQAPGPMLWEAGATVALATDCNPGTSYVESMAFVVALGVVQMGLTVEQAVWAATRGGAISLGMADAGTLKPGGPADLIVLDAPGYQHLAYRPASPLIWQVMGGGEWVTSALANNVGEGQSEAASSSGKDARRRRTGPVRRGGGRSWGRRWPF